MKLLKTGSVALFVISLTASCASYRTCPAYAQKSQQEIYNPDFKAEPIKAEKVRSL